GWIDLRKARDELTVARDIADGALRTAEILRGKAEEERETAINASLAKSQFLANMSHELRTPLNAILGFSEMLTLNDLGAKRIEYARLIHGSGTHLLGLVNDLLDLARIEAGKVQMQDEIVNFIELVEACAATVEPHAAEKSVVVHTNVERGLPFVLGDQRALRQILLNLLSNAVKFSLPDGDVEVFARCESSGELAFGVRDNGIGIAEDDLQRVFERFGQGRHDITSLEKGTGLGLPIVKGLVEALGGRVDMESRVGDGTCVTVWLPAKRLKAHQQNVAA
ncbi:MAG TPA: HAMP domain-containing sensor histidine kinase, partial [Rhizomicrobium sp.]